jgi:glycosyltransferase involved in cell wall biosynthesis
MTDDGTLGDRVLDDLGHNAARVRFWMNGVDRSIASSSVTRDEVRSELGLAEDTPLLLTVSRLSHWKRIDRAIDVASLLRERSIPVELAVVGAGDEEPRLRRQAEASSAAGHVRFIGGVERSHLAGFYRAADLLLSLYDYSNLANPVLESMVLGTPLLALDVGGTGNLVQDGINGVLESDADPHVLAERVAAILCEPEKRLALGRSAATWARENLWTWDERMKVEIAEIDRLISGGGN